MNTTLNISIAPDNHFLFSGGEVHCRWNVKLWECWQEFRITVFDYTMNGFMTLCEYAQILRENYPGRKIHVVYPYFPYARQDRWTSPQEPFSLQIFCEMVNAQHFDSVTITDPHSYVASAMIHNCVVQDALELVDFDKYTALVSPDAGSYKKVAAFEHPFVVTAMKSRDQNGKVQICGFHSPIELKDANLLIVDDICDGGATFIQLGEYLKANGAAQVDLQVTHGIFSKGPDALKGPIDSIYTTNSFSNFPASNFLHITEIF